jgi:cytochrome c oxidase assembly factor CtaG
MKLSDFTKMTSLEIVAFVIFVIYIVIPFKTPLFIANIVNGQFGLLILLTITVSLFIYTNPILGVIYIFVAYEVIRRSALVNKSKISHINGSLTEENKQYVMNKLNPETSVTLEETVISQMAPTQTFNTMEVAPTFLPIVEKIEGSSLYK